MQTDMKGTKEGKKSKIHSTFLLSFEHLPGVDPWELLTAIIIKLIQLAFTSPNIRSLFYINRKYELNI